ncbi:conjugal transfer protein TraR [Shewanella sp. GutCb]|uniref:conjugal transfer protein TraR n=1 Tax=Shewanella sp. GutCb TaxID=2058315 RepID=UPI000C7D9D24|nr:conjugal transfer protein TraR [Shewanella sp. GutCb]PKG73163.1 conjugal transfer protein TraR [Shewanella sp. GutCb]
MSDQFDRASEIEQRYRDDALAKQQSASHPSLKPYEQEGVRYCLDCHDAICTKRLIANSKAVRCVPCQQLRE